jgi:glycine cleavage system H protein
MEVLSLLEIKGMEFPLDRKYYTKNGAHLWLKQEEDLIWIGMDAFASEMIGFLTFLSVKKGRARSGESIGSFESAKFVSRFYSPVNGEVVAVNEDVLNNPRKINEDPYGSWIVAIKPDSGGYDGAYIVEGKEEILNWISEELKRVEENE